MADWRGVDMHEGSCTWPGCARKRRLRAGYRLCFRCWYRAVEAGVTADYLIQSERQCQYCPELIPPTAARNATACSTRCYQRWWRRQNAEYLKAFKAREYRENSAPAKARAAAHYAANTEAHRANVKAWQERNREKRRAHNLSNNARRRTMRADAYVEPINAKVVWGRDEGHCWICREPVDPTLRHPDPRSQSIDHVIPLKLGGLHAMSNAALAHLGCNCSKQDKMPDRFPDWFGRGEEPGAMAPTAA